MKLLLLPLIFLTLQNSSATSIVPEKSIYSFLNIFHKKNRVLEDGTAQVLATRYNRTGDLLPGSHSRLILPAGDYERLRSQAQAVFRALPGSRKEVFGTAFHIGDSLILTNHHVLSQNFSNFTHCDSLQIKDQEGNTFKCAKVHFCHKAEDVCLIELAPRKTGVVFNRGEDSFSTRPALKLVNRRPMDSEEAIVTVIGNSQGHGIHVSVGTGIKRRYTGFNFYAAIRDGNSGGPVINDFGEVIGIARRESKDPTVGTDAYNNAVSSDVLIGLIRQALENDPETLERFNLSVIE